MTQLIHFSAQKICADGLVDKIEFGVDVEGWLAEEDSVGLLQTICTVQWSPEVEHFLVNAIPRYIMSNPEYCPTQKAWAVTFQEPGSVKSNPSGFGVSFLASNLSAPVKH